MMTRPIPLTNEMNDAVLRLSGVAGRIMAVVSVQVTLISVCSICGVESKRTESEWPRSTYESAVATYGHGSPFQSHGVCPKGTPCNRYLAHDVIGE
jgi:hypothetical protein